MASHATATKLIPSPRYETAAADQLPEHPVGEHRPVAEGTTRRSTKGTSQKMHQRSIWSQPSVRSANAGRLCAAPGCDQVASGAAEGTVADTVRLLGRLLTTSALPGSSFAKVPSRSGVARLTPK